LPTISVALRMSSRISSGSSFAAIRPLRMSIQVVSSRSTRALTKSVSTSARVHPVRSRLIMQYYDRGL
jgi:hypothetical protein